MQTLPPPGKAGSGPPSQLRSASNQSRFDLRSMRLWFVVRSDSFQMSTLSLGPASCESSRIELLSIDDSTVKFPIASTSKLGSEPNRRALGINSQPIAIEETMEIGAQGQHVFRILGCIAIFGVRKKVSGFERSVDVAS